ncbi:MAG TPA: hypothetical protein VFX21_06595 [Acidimicrobiia bacterium]|nr:hypothetical protein [Acidimicrobiia bacterium]
MSSALKRPAIFGALASGVVFVAVLADRHWSVLRYDTVGGFYDLQAHRFLQGHLDVPADPLGYEGIFIGRRVYMYYGPWPAILRLPVAVFTHRFDGRLTQLSMLLAFAVALFFTIRLFQRVRTLVAGETAVTRGERWATGVFVFVVGAGSVLTFLASVGWVYHEAEIWGVALALAGFDFVVAYLVSRRMRDLVWASFFATLAFWARASVGAGPAAALALLLIAQISEPTRRLVAMPATGSVVRAARNLAVATVVPFGAYAAVNYAKFHSLFSVPLDRQIRYVAVNESRRAALADNGGSLFGLKFVPTTLGQYLRPDGIRVNSVFPWVSFPPRASIIGNATFDTIDLSSSVTACMPALAVLALVGLVAVVRARGRDAPNVAVLRAPIAGAALATGATVTIGFIANRYLSDFVPLLVLGAIAGFHVTLVWLRGPGTRGQRAMKRTVGVALVVLASFSLWANVGLAVLYERTLAPTEIDEWSLAGFIGFQDRVHDIVPGGALPNVRHGASLPVDVAALGTVFVVGDCDGLYWSNGDRWQAVERTHTTGLWRVRATFEPAGNEWQPLLTNGVPGADAYLGVRVRDDGRVVFGVAAPVSDGEWSEGEPQDIPLGTPMTVDLIYDPSFGRAVVRVEGRIVLGYVTPLPPRQDVSIGRNDITDETVPTFAGALSDLPVTPTLCHRLTR